MSYTRTLQQNLYGIERRLCLIFFILIITLASLYVYFVGKSIVNVVVREETELQIAEVNSRLSDLESAYLAQKDSINMEFAQAEGFDTISEKIFVTRGTLVGRSLSQNNEVR